MSWWQGYLAKALLGFLQSTIKNPVNFDAKYGLLLDDIRDSIDQIRPRPTVALPLAAIPLAAAHPRHPTGTHTGTHKPR